MKASIREGAAVTCPCCAQTVALQERPLTAMMGKVVIILHRHFTTLPDWVHVPTLITESNKLGAAIRGSEWSRLTLWGLLEARPLSKHIPPGKQAGYYRMPDKGHAFARGEVKIPKVARLYLDKLMGFGDVHTDIKECLGEELDYGQLMSGNYGSFIA